MSACAGAALAGAALAGAAELGGELAGVDQVGEDLELALGAAAMPAAARPKAGRAASSLGGEPRRVPLQGDDELWARSGGAFRARDCEHEDHAVARVLDEKRGTR